MTPTSGLENFEFGFLYEEIRTEFEQDYFLILRGVGRSGHNMKTRDNMKAPI